MAPDASVTKTTRSPGDRVTRAPHPGTSQPTSFLGACRSVAVLATYVALLLFLPSADIPNLLGAPSPAPLKHASSALALSADGSLLVVANPDSNSVTFLDTAAASVIQEIAVGLHPVSVSLLADGTTAYVSNFGSNTVSVVKLSASALSAELPVGNRPAGIAVSPDGRHIAVAEYGDDSIRWLDAQTLDTLSVECVDDRPYGLAFTPDGERLLVTHLLSGAVTVLHNRPHTAYLPLLSTGSPTALVAANATVPAEVSPQRIPTWPNVAPAPAVVINGNGDRAYLPQTMANGLGLNLTFDTSVFPKVSVINLATDQHQTSEHISLPETDQPVGLPWDVALAKQGRELWVVNSASNDVSVLDLSVPAQPARIANVPVQDNPRGIAISPDGLTAYVSNTLAGTVSVIDTATYTITKTIRTTTIPLPPTMLRGKKLFHSSARPDLARARWISCNTCHIEGEHDGRTWLLQYTGEIPTGQQPVIRRNTTSLLGMVETYPLRWSAEWDESADSEFSVRFEQFGAGLIQGDMHDTLGPPNQGRSYDLDCLATYIDSLLVPARVRALDQAELRGKAIFESSETGCTDCHPAPLYTDLKTHDVGTADGPDEWFGPQIDTPTLRFLYDSAPYLHDGSAATVLDVLTTHNPIDKHGSTTQLDGEELDDLAAFLLALPFAE